MPLSMSSNELFDEALFVRFVLELILICDGFFLMENFDKDFYFSRARNLAFSNFWSESAEEKD